MSKRRSDDFSRLHLQIKQAGLLAPQPGYYVGQITISLLLLGGLLAVLHMAQEPWILALLAVGLGIVLTRFGFLMHDAGHHQMFGSARKDTIVGVLIAGPVLGLSLGWWSSKHNQHHARPNHVDEDPDINNPAMAFSVRQALELRGGRRWLAAYQAYLFVPMTAFLVLSLHAKSLVYVLRSGAKLRWAELTGIGAHFIIYISVLSSLIGLANAVLVLAISKAVLGIYISMVFAPNHKGMPQVDDTSDLDYLRAQVITARNVRSAGAVDFIYGGLNLQIEHHLFPSMARNRLRAASEIVKSFCAEVGVPYYEVPMFQSLRETFAFFHAVGAPLRSASSTSNLA